MSITERQAVFAVAKEARAEFETGSVDQELLVHLYQQYHPGILDTSNFVRRAIPAFPLASCGLASVYMKHKLKDGEARYGSFRDFGHTVLVKGELVADITADQFGGPKVYVGPLTEPWYVNAVPVQPIDYLQRGSHLLK